MRQIDLNLPEMTVTLTAPRNQWWQNPELTFPCDPLTGNDLTAADAWPWPTARRLPSSFLGASTHPRRFPGVAGATGPFAAARWALGVAASQRSAAAGAGPRAHFPSNLTVLISLSWICRRQMSGAASLITRSAEPRSKDCSLACVSDLCWQAPK